MLSNSVQFDFHGERAIVTGACRGIGRAVANALADAGAEVEVFDVNGPVEADKFRHRFSCVDVTDHAAVDRAVGMLAAPPGMLVNNAGITRDRSIIKVSDGEWASVLSVNLTGAFNMLRAVAPLMTARGFGRIVNITSINGLRGKFGQANYAAAKAGLVGLTKTAARELGKKGITVNAVAPGMVMTDMARALPGDVLARAGEEAALEGLARPEDVSGTVMFLLSDAAGAITGEVIRVDAGQYI